MFDPANPKTWQARLTTAEVCAIGRFRPATLWRRIKAGTMPAAIDAGRQSIFDRDAVLKALGMVTDEQPVSAEPEWTVDPDAIRAARAREIRDRAEARKLERRRTVKPPSAEYLATHPEPKRRMKKPGAG